MEKIILPVFLLTLLLLGLTGCNAPQKETNSIQSNQQSLNSSVEQTQEIQQQIAEEKIDLNLDQEIDNLDKTLQEIKDDNFSEAELSDTNLGI